jgi:hypothetical protein
VHRQSFKKEQENDRSYFFSHPHFHHLFHSTIFSFFQSTMSFGLLHARKAPYANGMICKEDPDDNNTFVYIAFQYKGAATYFAGKCEPPILRDGVWHYLSITTALNKKLIPGGKLDDEVSEV